ncbi:protein PIF, partial [Elysia marginata]
MLSLYISNSFSTSLPNAFLIDRCTSLREGDVRQYGISCNAYWECVGFFPYSNATCCPAGQAFDGSNCVTDATCTSSCPPPPEFQFPVFCPYITSPAGPEYYRVVTNDFYIDKACPSGLLFDFDLCYCNGTSTDFCNEDLRLTFENHTIVDYSKNQQRLTLYPTARLFAFPNDTTVNFWGPNYIIAPGFANKEFRKISVVVVFEPTGATNNQVLLHNGPVGDPLGPSVKISITDSSTPGLLDVMFTLVLTLDTTAEAVPLNISVQKGGPIEARLKYTGMDVIAQVLKNGDLVAAANRTPIFID